jgi:hypothetical protein
VAEVPEEDATGAERVDHAPPEPDRGGLREAPGRDRSVPDPEAEARGLREDLRIGYEVEFASKGTVSRTSPRKIRSPEWTSPRFWPSTSFLVHRVEGQVTQGRLQLRRCREASRR